MRKLILNLAMSLDGYISDQEGGYAWIVGHGDPVCNTEETFEFADFMASIDVIVMGSKAYEDVVLSGLDAYADKKILVATSRNLEKKDNVTFITGDICSQVLSLKNKEGKAIWLFGGAELTDVFIKNDCVDEYIIGIIPTLLGSGRSLFKGDTPKIDLHLDRIFVNDGIPIMVYSKRQ